MSIKAVIAIGLLMILGAAPLAADTIFLKNGNRLEVDGAEVKGEKVNFYVFNGRMSIDISLVARIEKSAAPAAADAGLSNGISGKPFSRAAAQQQPALEDQPQNPDQEANAERAQLVEFYVTQRVNLMKELRMIDEQIQTLRGLIYAKSNIFSDTTTDRTRLTEFELRKRETEEKLQSMLLDARKAGLTPAEMRQLEAAKPDTVAADGTQQRPRVTTIGGPTNNRDSKVTWTDRDTDDERRSSKTVLGEEPVTEEPPV